MDEELNIHDLDVILLSLEYSKQRVADYPHHPSYEFKQQQLAPILETMRKVRALRKMERVK
jgi:hypothetical protein